MSSERFCATCIHADEGCARAVTPGASTGVCGNYRAVSSSRLVSLAATLAAMPDAPEEPRLIGDAAKAAHVAAQEAWLPTHLARCGVPGHFASLVVAGLKGDGFPAVAAAREWAAKPGAVFLLLIGGPGTGKSCAAAATCKLARRPFYGYDSAGAVFTSWQYDPRRAFYITAAMLSARAQWTDDGFKTWNRARTADLLVLDDLGVESMNEKGPFNGDFQDLVGDRHGNDRKTVLTTNLSAVAFKLRYGSRVVERIEEKGVVRDVGNTSKRTRLA